MRPEDINRFLQKALDEIEATNEEQKERFDRLREKIRDTGEAAAKALGELEETMRTIDSPESKSLSKLALERGQIFDAIKADLASAFTEQADLIERIAVGAKRR